MRRPKMRIVLAALGIAVVAIAAKPITLWQDEQTPMTWSLPGHCTVISYVCEALHNTP